MVKLNTTVLISYLPLSDNHHSHGLSDVLVINEVSR